MTTLKIKMDHDDVLEAIVSKLQDDLSITIIPEDIKVEIQMDQADDKWEERKLRVSVETEII